MSRTKVRRTKVRRTKVRVTAPASGVITTAAAINADNAKFWATSQANLDQHEMAKLQSKIAVQAGHNHKRTKKAKEGAAKKGRNTYLRVVAAMASYQARGISLERAADFIAPKIVNAKGKPLSSRQAKRHLIEAGYKARK